MKKILLTGLVATLSWNVQAVITETQYTVGNLSATVLAVTQNVSVASGDVVVMVAATNKKKSAAPISFATSAAASMTEQSAAGLLSTDPYPDSYIGYVTIPSGGSYDFIASYPGGGVTANVWLYTLSASSGSMLYLDDDAVAFDSDADTTLALSYGWDATAYDDIAIVEVGSARKGTLANPASGASGQRVPSYAGTNGTSAASSWDFTYDPANLGKNSGSIMGAVFAEGIVAPQPPDFNSNPVIKSIGITNQPYSGTLAGDASDPNGDPMTFLKDGGPAWLQVATNGVLTGTPLSGDLGTNQWPVLVTDGVSGTNAAALEILVVAGNPTPQTSQTNIIVIVVDDLGWMDLSIQGSAFYETPRIDSLATNGMRFTQGYAAHPRCLPSRYGLMTGRFPGANGVPSGPENNLRPWETTVAEVLQSGGYATAFMGKWHLIGTHAEDNLPQNQGFDINISGGKAGAPPTYFYPYGNQPSDELDKNGLFLDNTTPAGGMVTDRITGSSYLRTSARGAPGEYITDRLTDEALDWMDWNADKPMFLCMWHYGVHTPYEAPAGLISKYTAKLPSMDYGDLPEYIASGVGEQKMRQDHPTYAAMIESVDTNIGRLMDKVAALGITSNTVFIFTSDNGGLSNRGGYNTRELATANYPLRTGKGWLYEGGIREAFIVSGAGVVALVNSNAVVTGTDIYPTCLEIAGLALQPSNHHDGVSFAAALSGVPYDRGEPIFWHSSAARPYSTGDFNSTAIRDGDFKLILWYDTPGKNYELYNVSTDPGENIDLSESNPAKAAELLGKIQAWHAGAHEGSGVVFKSDVDDVSKPPQPWLDDPTIPVAMTVSGGSVDLAWNDYLGYDYDMYSQSNLLDAVWTSEGSGLTVTNATVPAGADAGFYKLELVLQPES